MLISVDHTELLSNVLFMAVFEHHLSRKLLLPHTFVLACVVRAKTGGDDEGRGIEMVVEVSGPPSVPGDEFMRPHSPEAPRP